MTIKIVIWRSECCESDPVWGVDVDRLGICSRCNDHAAFYKDGYISRL